jgi:putative hemolysin
MISPLDPPLSEFEDRRLRRFLMGLLSRGIGASRWQGRLARLSAGSLEEMLEKSFKEFQWRLSVLQTESLKEIDPKKPLLIVANHPHGLMDGYLMAAFCARSLQRKTSLVANKVAARVCVNLNPWLIPVDNQGPQGSVRAQFNKIALTEIKKRLRQNEAVVYFPAGEVSFWQWRKRNVMDGPWKLTPFLLAQETQAQILPVCIYGRPSLLFLSLRVFSRTLGRLCLFREMKRTQNRHFRLSVGGLLTHNQEASAVVLAQTARARLDEMKNGGI